MSADAAASAMGVLGCHLLSTLAMSGQAQTPASISDISGRMTFFSE